MVVGSFHFWWQIFKQERTLTLTLTHAHTDGSYGASYITALIRVRACEKHLRKFAIKALLAMAICKFLSETINMAQIPEYHFFFLRCIGELTYYN